MTREQHIRPTPARRNKKSQYAEYVHRSCPGCGRRIPRWTDGKETPASREFCSKGCGQFYRRFHRYGRPDKVEAQSAKNEPILRALLKPVPTIEGRPEYAPCGGCGRTIRTELIFCNDRCWDYVPLSLRKPDGAWFIVAGPADYCSVCGLAIVPYQLPYRVAGELICRDCRSTMGRLRVEVRRVDERGFA